MHRSGTSLVARILSECGLYLGPEDDMLPAGDSNAEGFWENVRFTEVNNAVLAALGGDWDDPPAQPPAWESDVLAELRGRAKSLVDEFEAHGHFGWKDPRSALTLPFWRGVVPELRTVIAVRHPLEVARSLSRRHAMSEALGLRLWLAYNRSLLESSQPDDRVVTHFASYFGEADSEARRVAQELGLLVDTASVVRAGAAVSTWARHHSVDTTTDLPSEVAVVYDALCAEAGPTYQATRTRVGGTGKLDGGSARPDRSPDASRPSGTGEKRAVSTVLGCRYTTFEDAPGSTHMRVVELVPRQANVLEFGCATGFMSKVLVEQRGCRVTGIEIDAAAARAAAEICARVVVGDADELDYEDVLGEERFDVILFGDVLEHLRDPGGVLSRVRPYLAPGGTVIASIPNVAHASVRLALLHGRFPYRDKGLLDSTHLRFFTRESIQDVFEAAGYSITLWSRQRVALSDTEIEVPGAPSAEELEPLQKDPEATTYQFIVRAERLDASADLEAARRLLQSTREEVEQLRPLAKQGHDLAAAVQELERLRPLAGLAEEVEQLRRAHEALGKRIVAERAAMASYTEEADTLMATWERELTELRKEVEWRRDVGERLEDETAWRKTVMNRLEAEVAALQRQVAMLEGSRSFRYTAPLRSVAGRLRPPRP